MYIEKDIIAQNQNNDAFSLVCIIQVCLIS